MQMGEEGGLVLFVVSVALMAGDVDRLPISALSTLVLGEMSVRVCARFPTGLFLSHRVLRVLCIFCILCQAGDWHLFSTLTHLCILFMGSFSEEIFSVLKAQFVSFLFIDRPLGVESNCWVSDE